MSVVALSALVACSLTTDLNGFSGGGDAGPVSDGSVDGQSTNDGSGPVLTFDAGADASKGEPLPNGGVIVVKGVNVDWAGGAPQQHHAVFMEAASAWAIFYLRSSSSKEIAHKLTGDFITFADGASVVLPSDHNNDGRGFDVTYAKLGVDDVVHVGVSVDNQNQRRHFHARKATSSPAFSTPVEISNNTTNNFNTLDPDGTSVLILESGKVLTATGFTTVGNTGHVGNAGVFLSKNADVGGATWPAEQEALVEVEVESSSVNARALTRHPNGAFMVWDRGDDDPMPSELGWAKLEGATWGAPGAVDLPKTKMNIADWGLAMSGGKPNVVRYANGQYLHRVYDGGWQAGPAIPSAPHAGGEGLVVLDVGGTLTIFALTAQTGALRRSRFVSGGWSAWEEIAAPSSTRHQLSGSVAGNTAVLLWTNVDGGSKDLVLFRVP